MRINQKKDLKNTTTKDNKVKHVDKTVRVHTLKEYEKITKVKPTKGKVVVFYVMKSSDKSIVSVATTQKEAIEIVKVDLLAKNYEHFINWSILHGYSAEDPATQAKYLTEVVDNTAIDNRYMVKPVELDASKVASVLCMVIGCKDFTRLKRRVTSGAPGSNDRIEATKQDLLDFMNLVMPGQEEENARDIDKITSTVSNLVDSLCESFKKEAGDVKKDLSSSIKKDTKKSDKEFDA